MNKMASQRESTRQSEIVPEQRFDSSGVVRSTLEEMNEEVVALRNKVIMMEGREQVLANN